MPMLSVVLPYVNALVQVLISGANALAKIFGYVEKGATNTESALSGIKDGADEMVAGVEDSANKLKNVSFGMDELHTIAPQGEVAGANTDANFLEGFDLGTYDSLITNIKQKSDDVAQSIIKFFEPIKSANIQPLVDSLHNLWESLSLFGGEIGGGLSDFLPQCN